MTTGFRTWLGKTSPYALIIGIVGLGVWVEFTHDQQLEKALMDKLSSVTSTLACTGYTSDMTKADLSTILKNNGLEGYELAFVSKDQTEGGFIKVISSESMYQSDEPFRDKNSWLSDHYDEPGQEIRTYEGGITKTITYSPVIRNDSTTGVFRLSSGPHQSEVWNWKVLWPYALGLILLALLTVLKASMGPSRNNSISIDKKLELDSELRRKDTELKMLSLVAKKSQNLMLITDAKGVILWVNETYENKNNYSAEELNTFVGRHLPDVSKNIHIRTIIRNVVDFRKSVVYESESEGENGKVHYAMTTVTPVSDESGNVNKLLFVDTDITKLKVIEKENDIFKRFTELSPTPILRLSREGKVTFHNDASKKLLNEWCERNGTLNDRMCTLVQGVLDSCEGYSFEQQADERTYLVRFHPNCEDQTLYVVAEALIDVKIVDRITGIGDERLLG